MKKRLTLSPYAANALFLTAAATAGLSLLTALSAVLSRWGSTPLQHYILTRQLAGRVPETFFCGLLSVFLCEVLSRRLFSE